MNRSKRSACLRLRAAWESVLANANHLAVNLDDLEELHELAGIRDYVADQIAACSAKLSGQSANVLPLFAQGPQSQQAQGGNTHERA